MIGIATVARPEDDGIRNDSGRNSTNITIANAASPTSPSADLGPVEHRVGDLAVVHDHRDAAGDPDDQGHPEQVAGAVDERRRSARPRSCRPIRPMTTEKSRNDAVISGNHHQSVGQPDPEVLPGDHAVHHHSEGQAEDDEDHLVAAGQHLDSPPSVGRA